MRDLVLRSRRVVTPGGVLPATIRIRNGLILAVGGFGEEVAGADLVDVGDAVVMPGVVDSHVHVNEPGRTEWEGFETATRAAAAGGVTTICDMPLNSVPVTTTPAGVVEKEAAARGKTFVDYAFWGGLVPANVRGAGSTRFSSPAFRAPSAFSFLRGSTSFRT